MFWSDAFQSNKTLVSTHSVPKYKNNNKNQKTHKKNNNHHFNVHTHGYLNYEHHTKCLKLINADILVFFLVVFEVDMLKKYLLGLGKNNQIINVRLSTLFFFLPYLKEGIVFGTIFFYLPFFGGCNKFLTLVIFS